MINFLKGLFASKRKLSEEINKLKKDVEKLSTSYIALSDELEELEEKYIAIVEFNKEVIKKTNEIILKPYISEDESDSEKEERWKKEQSKVNDGIFAMFGWGDDS